MRGIGEKWPGLRTTLTGMKVPNMTSQLGSDPYPQYAPLSLVQVPGWQTFTNGRTLPEAERAAQKVEHHPLRLALPGNEAFIVYRTDCLVCSRPRVV
ncbi:hypothetical protein CPLU01_08516 [Colletotrichum plurivorum]|uniref:Uncharacterized protein n=1 Tax=Colletotrichum plurivorum TaxID=2175906 RepID=A0A8H6KBV6_9PEZI|nr:hypothetical protein CPLU01_08516 [Colletotrichum plurivorum]